MAEVWKAFQEVHNQKSIVIKEAIQDYYRKKTDETCKYPAQIWKRYQ